MGFDLFGITIQFAVLWMIVAIIFSVAEGLTLGLTFIWFAGGAVLAMLLSFLKLPVLVQVIGFLLGTTLMLIYTRPVAKKVLKIGAVKTNVDSLIGKEGIVIKDLESFTMGQVKVKGQIWTAKPLEDIKVIKGTEVEVIRIEGVKLIVKPINK